MKESELIGLIGKLQEQISAIDKKVDMIMGRVMATPALMANSPKFAEQRPQSKPVQQPQGKPNFQIICTDCGKSATLPFKPVEGRPVYCKECFSLRRKGGNGPIRAEESKPNVAPSMAPAPVAVVADKKKPAKAPVKKKAAPAKKPAVKKKPLKKKK